MMDLAATFIGMHAAVSGASTAGDALKDVIAVGERMGGVIPEDIKRASAEEETQLVARQLRGILERHPLPATITFLYFGLFPRLSPETNEEAAGLYVAGGESTEAEPVIDGYDDLPWFPQDEYLDSPPFERVKIEALREGADYNFFDYTLMFGAAAVLAKFAARALHLEQTLLVGFDSGDKVVVVL